MDESDLGEFDAKHEKIIGMLNPMAGNADQLPSFQLYLQITMAKRIFDLFFFVLPGLVVLSPFFLLNGQLDKIGQSWTRFFPAAAGGFAWCSF